MCVAVFGRVRLEHACPCAIFCTDWLIRYKTNQWASSLFAISTRLACLRLRTRFKGMTWLTVSTTNSSLGTPRIPAKCNCIRSAKTPVRCPCTGIQRCFRTVAHVAASASLMPMRRERCHNRGAYQKPCPKTRCASNEDAMHQTAGMYWVLTMTTKTGTCPHEPLRVRQQAASAL